MRNFKASFEKLSSTVASVKHLGSGETIFVNEMPCSEPRRPELFCSDSTIKKHPCTEPNLAEHAAAKQSANLVQLPLGEANLSELKGLFHIRFSPLKDLLLIPC